MNDSHDKALRLLWDRKPEEALSILRTMDTSVEILNDRAVALYFLNEKTEALALIDQALKEKPDYGPALLNSKYIRLAKPVEPSRYRVIEDWGAPQSPQPAVSVVMPTYNRGAFIEESVRSVLAQTRTDFELVIANDGGSKDCEAIIKRIGTDKIHYLYIEHGGQSVALNAAIAHSRGRYITYLDDDDIFYPEHIKTTAEFLDANPDVKVAFTHAMRATQVLKNGTWRVSKRALINATPFNRAKIVGSNRLAMLNVMSHKNVVDELGGFNENLEVAGDWEMWLRISAQYPFHRVDKVTGEYRIRSGKTQLTSKVSRQRRYDNIIIFLHRLLPVTSRMPDNNAYARAMNIFGPLALKHPIMLDLIDLRHLLNRPKKMYPLFLAMGTGFLKEGDRAAAIASFQAAIKSAPFEPKLRFALLKAKMGKNDI